MTQPKEAWENDQAVGGELLEADAPQGWSALLKQEDWWAVWLGAGFILVGVLGWVTSVLGVG